MKKVLVLVAAAAIFSSVAFAEKVVEIGVKGGVLINTGTRFVDDLGFEADGFDNEDGKKVSGGGDIGFYSHFGIAEFGSTALSLQPELFFAFGNGVKYEEKIELGDETISYTEKYKYTSLDIALLLGYDIPIGKARLTPFLGPKVGISVGKMKLTSEGSGEKYTEKLYMNVATFGVDFGIGFAIPLGSKFVLGGDVRYGVDYKVKSIGSDISDDYEEYLPGGLMRRSALGINITAGFRF